MEGGLINPLALIRTGAAEGVTSNGCWMDPAVLINRRIQPMGCRRPCWIKRSK